MTQLPTLPRGWSWSTVDQVGRVQLGRQRAPQYHEGGNMKPYLRVANVFEDRIETCDVKKMHFAAEEYERYRLVPGDILLCEGQTPELLGRPALYRGLPSDVGFTNSLIRFQASSAVDPRWALVVFRHHMHSGRFSRESRITTNIAHLSASRFKSVEFPVPPLEEQLRIVEVLEAHLTRLDAAEELLGRSRDRLRPLELLELQQSLDRSGGPEVPLSTFVQRIEAGRSFGGSARPAKGDEWVIIKVSAMTWGQFRPSENKAVPAAAVDPRYEIKPGDLLVSRANTTAYVGAAVLVGETRPRLLLSDKSLRIVGRPGVDQRWLLAALTSPRARKQISALATGTKDSMRNISQANLLTVLLPAQGDDDRARVVRAREESADRTGRLTRQLEFTRARAKVLRRELFAAAFRGQLTPAMATNIKELACV